VPERHRVFGNQALIDTKPSLAYTQSYQKQKTHPFFSQIDLSLGLEGIKNEVPKILEVKITSIAMEKDVLR